MGLDMYAFTVAKNDGNEQFAIAEDNERTEIAYWRKFNALHGWMEDTARGLGFDGEFNCVPVQLSPALIDQLEDDLRHGQLKPREGFFFGAQEFGEEDVESVVSFIETCRDAFAEGKDVYYDSLW